LQLVHFVSAFPVEMCQNLQGPNETGDCPLIHLLLRHAPWLTALLVLATVLSAQTARETEQQKQKLEQQKFDLEKARVEGDLRLREEELKLRREELQAKLAADKGQGFTAVTGTLAVALIGLLGAAIAGLIQAHSNHTTEKRKFESDLILKAIETGDLEASTRNLGFLLKAGFIADPQGTIAALAKEEETVPVLPARAYTSGIFEGIPAEGVGGDPELNLRKNRDRPPQQYTAKTLEAIIAQKVPADVEATREPRRNWPQEALAEIDRVESQGVMVEGFVKRAHAGGPTAANARMRGPSSTDWSVSLVSNPDDDLAKAVIAVITPRTRAGHAAWTLEKLKRLSDARQRVRISGWLLFGQPTLQRIGKAATRWRIHPTMNIEVSGPQGWVDLSDAP
jgi:hypothetical protein